MNVVYCGCGKFGNDCLNALLKNNNHKLAHIITHPAKPTGRGKQLKANEIQLWAENNNVPFTAIEDINSAEGVKLVEKLEPDLLVVIAFGQKISDQIISIPAKGAVNVHGSLLPKYRGAAPINWAIINGEKKTGISIITLAQKMDAGAILATSQLAIPENANAGEIHDALAKIAAPVLMETINKIATGNVEKQKQDDSVATKAPKLKKADGYIDFYDSAENIHNKIRGLTPWPAVSVKFVNGKSKKSCNITLLKTQVVENSNKNKDTGTLDKNLNLLCKQGTLKILELKPHGKTVMNLKSFINGYGSKDKDCFVKIESNR